MDMCSFCLGHINIYRHGNGCTCSANKAVFLIAMKIDGTFRAHSFGLCCAWFSWTLVISSLLDFAFFFLGPVSWTDQVSLESSSRHFKTCIVCVCVCVCVRACVRARGLVCVLGIMGLFKSQWRKKFEIFGCFSFPKIGVTHHLLLCQSRK